MVEHVRVVVVDDHASAREALVTLLQRAGFSAFGVARGDDALRMLMSGIAGKVHALITDYIMPGLDGMKLVESVRSLSHLKDLYITMVTGADAPELRQRAMCAGVDVFLLKPYAVKELIERLRLQREFSGPRSLEQAWLEYPLHRIPWLPLTRPVPSAFILAHEAPDVAAFLPLKKRVHRRLPPLQLPPMRFGTSGRLSVWVQRSPDAPLYLPSVADDARAQAEVERAVGALGTSLSKGRELQQKNARAISITGGRSNRVMGPRRTSGSLSHVNSMSVPAHDEATRMLRRLAVISRGRIPYRHAAAPRPPAALRFS